MGRKRKWVYKGNSPYRKHSMEGRFVNGKLTSAGCCDRHYDPRHLADNQWEDRLMQRKEYGYD
jgi:hypothetical protein